MGHPVAVGRRLRRGVSALEITDMAKTEAVSKVEYEIKSMELEGIEPIVRPGYSYATHSQV